MHILDIIKSQANEILFLIFWFFSFRADFSNRWSSTYHERFFTWVTWFHHTNWMVLALGGNIPFFTIRLLLFHFINLLLLFKFRILSVFSKTSILFLQFHTFLLLINSLNRLFLGSHTNVRLRINVRICIFVSHRLGNFSIEARIWRHSWLSSWTLTSWFILLWYSD